MGGTLLRALALAALVVGSAASLSCNVNDYCLNCGTGDGGPDGDAQDGGGDDGGTDDAGDGGPCVPTGAEQCDGVDNNCNGLTDEGTLPQVGDDCDNQMGVCAGGKKVCENGALTCDRRPSAETCDNLDNNCNGQTDEGNPGGGGLCGTNVGECTAGINQCVNGQVTCVGAVGSVGAVAESCNNLDDDCDGVFDEDITGLPACTGVSAGLCDPGTPACVGGTVVCVGRVEPQFELCDTIDQDCDGDPLNGFLLNTDPLNCGACGNVCDLTRAIEGCASGQCTVAACETNYHNNDGNPANGCEFGPCTKQGDAEICNGVDDECDGQIDDGITPPSNSFCSTIGQCGAGNEQTVGTDTDADGSTVVCAGAAGFQCVYADPDVQIAADGFIEPETLCDGKDNDCDGLVDEGQPNLGEACDNGEVGACRSAGTYQCDPADLNGPALCVFTTVGTSTPGTEDCDGVDDDCDGVIDNGFAAGNLAGQDWVMIPNPAPGAATQIMKYEASRPDATGTAGGLQATHTCSRPGVQPWTNVTYPQAQAACQAIGARLCTETEWESMCAQEPGLPASTPGNTTDYTLIEAELMTRTAGTTPANSWSAFNLANIATFPGRNYSGTGFVSTADNNASGTTTAAARLTHTLTLAAGTYSVWARVLSPSGSSDTLNLGIYAATPTINLTVANTGVVTNKNNEWQWVRSTSTFTVAAAGTFTVAAFQLEDGLYVDALALTQSTSTNPPPFDDKIWAYGTSPKLPQATVCNGDEYDTVAGGADQDDILATGSLAQCFANGTGTNDAFDMSGNVKEWAAARAPGQNPLRGGASNNEVDGLACGLDFTLANDAFAFPNVGFRCCR